MSRSNCRIWITIRTAPPAIPIHYCPGI